MSVTLKDGETLFITTRIEIRNASTATSEKLDDFYITLDGDIVLEPFSAISDDDREILIF